MTVRTRMAPSPTGEYHIGGIRGFLYNYAWAKKNGGQMVLRIEDTDQEREVKGATQRLIQDIKDYGLSWDEGPDVGGPYAPYTQSERTDLYREYAQKLVDSGHAYYCFCTKDRLTELRTQQQEDKQQPKYDKKCLSLSKDELKAKLDAGESYVVRLNVVPGQDISWDDVVMGEITINTDSIDDQVLLKSDGFPTYHLAVVVDDYLMKINLVMRGQEWVPSTPKQILLYKAFGWDVPRFGHLALLKEKGSNKKMSKRFGDVHARAFLESGYVPEALLNFLMLLGWNPGTDREFYTLDEFVEDFTLDRLHKTDLVAFDRDKLLWMNGHYIRNMPIETLLERLRWWASQTEVELDFGNVSEERILEVLDVVREKTKVLADIPAQLGYFFEKPHVDAELLHKYSDRSQELLDQFVELFGSISDSDWTKDQLDKICHEFIGENGYKPKEAFMTLRVVLSGKTITPPIFDVLAVLGKSETLSRLEVKN